MGAKVTFDSSTKIIQVDVAPVGGIVDIDVKVDLYSDGKEDWKDDPLLNRFLFPITAVGGDPLPGSKSLGSTFFLEYGWQIRPYEGDHILNINGNMFARDGSNPYISTIGSYNVQIIQSVSSLVDSTVQQLKEIERMAFSNGVSYDASSVYSGTEYPVGTHEYPVNNITDAVTILEDYGFRNLFVEDNLTLTGTEALSGYNVIGESEGRTLITIPDAATMFDCTISNASVTGYLDGDNKLDGCTIFDLFYIKGKIINCTLNPGTITLGSTGHAQMDNCKSGVPGSGVPYLDFNGSGQTLAIRDYTGGIGLQNKTGTDACSIDMHSGQVKLAASISAGTITIRGIGSVTEDLSTGTAVIDDSLLNTDSIWSHIKALTVAKFLGNK